MRYAKDGDDDFRDFLSSSAAAALVQCCLFGCATVILRCLQQFKIAYFLDHLDHGRILLITGGSRFLSPHKLTQFWGMDNRLAIRKLEGLFNTLRSR